MIRNILVAVSMPIIVTLAYIFGNNGVSDLASLNWLYATAASALYSLAIFRAGKIKGVCSFIGIMPIYTIFV